MSDAIKRANEAILERMRGIAPNVERPGAQVGLSVNAVYANDNGVIISGQYPAQHEHDPNAR